MMPSTSKSNRRKAKSKFIPKPNQEWRVKEQKRNWLELPYDITANILHRVGAHDILENAQKVCTTWHKICKDPAMWRVISMENIAPFQPNERPRLRKMCKHAVDRSQGQLVDLTIVDFCDDDLLEYISDRSSQLRRLELAWCCSDICESWTKALEKLPLLEELNLYSAFFKEEFIAVIARCCPMLRTLKMNQEADRYWYGYDGDEGLNILNEIPIAIGEKLHELRHLEIIGMNISNFELKVILEGCHLESLDLCQCLFVNLDGEFGKKCSEKIKCLKLPNESLEGCPYLYRNGVPRDSNTDEYEDSEYDYSEDITCLHEFMGVHDDDDDDFMGHHALGVYIDDDDLNNIEDLQLL